MPKTKDKFISIQTLARPQPQTIAPTPARALSQPLAPARWIWAPDEGARANQFVIFARSLPTCAAAPIRIRICASQSYELYLNGHFIGRGPVTGSDSWRLFDQYLWTPAPDASSVEVAIVALHETPPPAAVWPVEPGVIASFASETWEVGTGENWRCLELQSWRANGTKRGGALGFCEDYDAHLAPDGWREKVFAPDESWGSAREIALPDVDWQPRATPYLKRSFVAPRTFWGWRAGEVGATEVGEISQFCDAEPLEAIAAPRAFDVENINALLAGGAGAFTFDLGAEYLGFYALQISAPRGTVVEISGAELLQTGAAHNENAHSENAHSENAHSENAHSENAHSENARPAIFRKSTRYSARLRAGENLTDFVSWNWSGFRYLHIVVRGAPQNVRLERVGALERRLQLPPARPLSLQLQRELGGDAQLKRIFELCQRTLEIGAQEHLIDCPTREQLQYWGDAVWVAQSLWRGWGDGSFLEFFLECFLRVPLRPDGQICCVFPGQTAQVLLDYSLIPLLGQRFFHANTGAFYRPRATLDKALQLKKWYDARRDGDGLVSFDFEALKAQGVVNFIDHPGLGWHNFPHRGLEREGTSAALNLFYCGFVQSAARIAASLGDPRAADLAGEAEKLALALRRRFYDGAVFHDADNNGEMGAGTSWQTNALAVYFGVLQGAQARRAMQAMLEGYDNLCRCSPYFHFFFLAALRLAGLETEARELIKREWAPMLQGGATTAWEGFAGDEKDSLCHPWSCAPFGFLLDWNGD